MNNLIMSISLYRIQKRR